MDRRFLTWLLLTSALFFLYLSMRPQQQAPAPGRPGGDQQAQAPAADDPLLREQDTFGDTSNEAAAAAETPEVSTENAERLDPAEPQPDFPAQLVTLGSSDATEKYNLSVTVSSEGGSLHRVEVVQQSDSGRFRYRALEHEGGYLGFLGTVPSADGEGLQIRTVPKGSPASLASSPTATRGLQVDDILLQIDELPVTRPQDLEEALLLKKPGTVVKLLIRRNGKTINYEASLSEVPLDLIRLDPRDSEQIVGNEQRPGLLTTLAAINGTSIPNGYSVLPALKDTLTTDWETRPLEVNGGDGIEFRLPLQRFLRATGRPPELEMVKRYRLLPESSESDGFLLDLETEIVNRNDVPVTVAIRQEGLDGLTLEGWWYSVKISPYMFSGAGHRDVAYNSDFEGHALATTRQVLDRAESNLSAGARFTSANLFPPPGQATILLSELEPPEARKLNYIGLDTQYFNTSFLPHPEQPDSLTDLSTAAANVIVDPLQLNKSQAQAANTFFWFETREASLEPGESLKRRYRIFLGPKKTEVLAAHGLDRTLEYGWFGWIAKPLSAILHFFHMLVANYAVAIVMLTVVVRGCMFPLSRKAAVSAQRMQDRMQVLQPEMKKINEKYKDDWEKRTKAMQDLYAKHNFNPTEQLSGCLPMFIQLPIFMGLYRCLSVDISLRQQPLIPGMSWCSNLAGPDMLFQWSSWMPEFISGRGTGWLGPYFNILPMVTVALFLLQQKMLMPKATDEQTRMTQNVMQVMTIFMGVLFFKVPSGLCIYFITSSLWSLVERKLVKKYMPASATAGATAGAAATPTAANTSANSAAAKPRDIAGKRGRDAAESKTGEKSAGRFQEIMQMLEKPAVKSSTQRGTTKHPRTSRKKDRKRKR